MGGGVAGPATALALHRVGFDAEVLEGRPADPGDTGSFLTLAPNGVDALARPRRARPGPRRGRAQPGATPCTAPPGGCWETVTLGRPARRRHSGPDAAPLPDRVGGGRGSEGGRCAGRRYGARVRACRRDHRVAGHPRGRRAILEADLVVGADGVHSLVRRTIDPTAPAAPLRRPLELRRPHPRDPRALPGWHPSSGTSSSAAGPSSGRTPRRRATCCGSSTCPGPELSREERGADDRGSGASTWSTCSPVTPDLPPASCAAASSSSPPT